MFFLLLMHKQSCTWVGAILSINTHWGMIRLRVVLRRRIVVDEKLDMNLQCVLYPRLHQKKDGQQIKGGHSAPLLWRDLRIQSLPSPLRPFFAYPSCPLVFASSWVLPASVASLHAAFCPHLWTYHSQIGPHTDFYNLLSNSPKAVSSPV